MAMWVWIVGMVYLAMISVWYWMEMDKNAVLRQFEHSDEEVAHLAGQSGAA